ncbi:SUMF1/EgtB/PvdO family nonheme iron enzyme [Myxococcota bacterium]|nr:SUMF1/EgtB/PvdO family nonheme iron enzyme [Myxococcota bacterium]
MIMVSTSTDPSGPASGSERALRGGCFVGSAASLRTSGRAGDPPMTRAGNVGFRCARSQ